TARDGGVGVAIQAMKRFPNLLAFRHWDARSLIFDPNACRALVITEIETDRNRLSGRAVFHGVVEQIDQHLTHRTAIDIGDDILVEVDAYLNLTRAGQRGERLEYFAHQGRQLRPLGHERILTTLHAVEAEHLVDEVTQTPRLLVDDVERARMLLRRTNPAHAQQLGEHPDLRQWGAELV